MACVHWGPIWKIIILAPNWARFDGTDWMFQDALHTSIERLTHQQNINAPTETATLPPDELNLQTGLELLLEELTSFACKREDVQNGIDRESQARMGKETADSHFEVTRRG